MVVRVPIRLQLDDLVVEPNANVTRHGDNHRLARLGLASGLVVRNQVFSYFLKACVCPNNGFECGPL